MPRTRCSRASISTSVSAAALGRCRLAVGGRVVLGLLSGLVRLGSLRPRRLRWLVRCLRGLVSCLLGLRVGLLGLVHGLLGLRVGLLGLVRRLRGLVRLLGLVRRLRWLVRLLGLLSPVRLLSFLCLVGPGPARPFALAAGLRVSRLRVVGLGVGRL